MSSHKFDIGDMVCLKECIQANLIDGESTMPAEVYAILRHEDRDMYYRLAEYGCCEYNEDELIFASDLQKEQIRLLAEMSSKVGLVGTFHALKG